MSLTKDNNIDSNSINELVSEIISCKELLLDNLNIKGVIKIEDEIKDKIFNFIGDNDKNRDISKLVIKKALNLNERDAVIYLNDKIVIKAFAPHSEKRYKGLPADELRDLKSRIFENEYEIKILVMEVVEDLMSEDLNFKKISNIYFMNNYLKIIQKRIVLLLSKKIDEERVLIEGMANYILRESFNLILKVMSNNLLKLIMNRDENAEMFVNYYNGEIEVDKNGKYKRPEITDNKNQKLNTSRVITITSSYNLFLTQIKKVDKNIKYLEEEVNRLKEKNIITKIEETKRNLNQEKIKREKIVKVQKSTEDKFNIIVDVMAKTLHKKRVKLENI